MIAAELPKEMAGIYWAKNMYWRAGKPERFVRPVRWMVALLDGEVVPVRFGGYEAGAVTYGHRVLFGDAPIALAAPGSMRMRCWVGLWLRCGGAAAEDSQGAG